MEKYLKQILKYLPIQFSDEEIEAKEFIKYLSNTYIENLEKEKYQFAFKAFHMLYMTCIYKFSWFLKHINNEPDEEKTYRLKIKNNGQAKVQEETISIHKLFEYSLMNESETIQKLLKKT